MRILASVSALVALLLGSCGGAPAGEVDSLGADGVGTAQVGEFVLKPTGEHFVVDPSEGGRASSLRVVEMVHGRLVDVYDLSAAGDERLWFRDFLIGENVQSDGLTWRVELEPVTQRTSLVIFRENDPQRSDDEFDDLLRVAEDSAQPIFAKGPGDLPPFSVVPRNGALVVRFSDVVDASSVNRQTVRLLVGSPASAPFEARIFADSNHGALVLEDGGPTFHPTRAVVDLTISELEASLEEPPLSPSVLGLPPSRFQHESNVALRIPSRIDFASGQFAIVQNPTGHGLSSVPEVNGPIDTSVGSHDVLRLMRSGSELDLNRGYLVDLERPVVIGEQVIRVLSAAAEVTHDPNPGDAASALHEELEGGLAFRLDIEFDSVPCALQPRPGDVLDLSVGRFVVQADGASPVAGEVSGLRVRSLSGPFDASDLIGSGSYLVAFDPLAGHRPACFLQLLPAAHLPPTDSIEPHTQVRVRFSEPMDPASLTAFDNWMVTATDDDPLPEDVVVGTMSAAPDLRTFTWTPVLPLEHSLGSIERYFLRTSEGARPIADLAGNPVVAGLGRIPLTVRGSADTQTSGNYVLRFSSRDEDGNGDYGPDGELLLARPEVRGQILIDVDAGVIRPRAVSRFTSLVDSSQRVVNNMGLFPPGVQTPLSPLGSRLMHLWRYVDFGFTFTDETLYNLDVEGLHWAPADGQTVADSYENFRIRLGHSHRFPDEYVEGIGNVPYWGSGLRLGSWDSPGQNLVDGPGGAMKTVYPKEGGYRVDPSDVWVGASGIRFQPYPLNRDSDPADAELYTWRDTAILGRGAPDGGGVDPGVLINVGLIEINEHGMAYRVDEVPTIGLPLLMEYSCFPSNTGLGLNAFTVSIATNLLPKPQFRLFATGGLNQSGDVVVKDPDLQSKPTGGFNPSNGGNKTPGGDPVFYWGATDFLVRVSRLHTIWIDAQRAVDWTAAVVEPDAASQPDGTSLVLAFRGASFLGEAQPGAAADANNYDAYGGPRPTGGFGQGLSPVDFVGGTGEWTDSLEALAGARYAQVRATFVANHVTGDIPLLSAIGLAFRD